MRSRTLRRYSRRDLLRQLGTLGLAAAIPSALAGLEGCSSGTKGRAGDGTQPASAPLIATFDHGVVSGDPLADAVILWTRVTPLDGNDERLEGTFEVSTTADFARVVAGGAFAADKERDYTVKVDVKGLESGTTYYYRFVCGSAVSPIGRTRTAPKGAVDRLRFAVVSCSSLAHGYFHAYRSVANRLDLDAVIHLGDYIYEYASGVYGAVRPYEPAHEIVTLADYRARYAHYRKDKDLQAVHRQHAFICVWDDHEFANDASSTGAENHDPATEGSWDDRKKNAARAYSEWMPIRDSEDGHIYRAFAFGDLVDLVMLDTRIFGRDAQTTPSSAETKRADRQLLGKTQEAWLTTTLTESKAKWRLVGQQVMIAPLPQQPNPDMWDGHVAARERFLSILTTHAVADVVVLTGDIHCSFANDIPADPTNTASYDGASGKGALAVEFVTPGVTSPGLSGDDAKTAELVLSSNPWMKYVQMTKRGYVVVDVTRERVQGAWFHFDGVETETASESFAAAFAVKSGESVLKAESAAAPPRAEFPAAAPT